MLKIVFCTMKSDEHLKTLNSRKHQRASVLTADGRQLIAVVDRLSVVKNTVDLPVPKRAQYRYYWVAKLGQDYFNPHAGGQAL